MVECLPQDQRAAGLSLTGVTALWSLSKTTVFKLQIADANKSQNQPFSVSKGHYSKKDNSELWFLHCMLSNICLKFHVDSLVSFQVIE